MKRRSVGLLQRLIRFLIKNGIMQNLNNKDKSQPLPGLSNMSSYTNRLTSSFIRNQIKNISYGGRKNLVIPTPFLTGPVWRNIFDNSHNTENVLLKNKIPWVKIPYPTSNLGGSKQNINKVPSANYSDEDFSLKNCLLRGVQDRVLGTNKITVVGAGSVGVACAYTILVQNLTNQLCMVDAVKDKLEGEVLDMKHGSTFGQNFHVQASTDYEATANSSICIVTAGVRQKEGESRLSLMSRNIEVMKTVIPPLVRHSPHAVLIIASNPVDIMTYISWKLSGLPKGRVFGSGTNLDSSRFRYYIAQRLGIAPVSCHGWIIGEHGDTSVAVWSGVNVAGVRLADINPSIGQPDDPEHWSDVHKKVINSAEEVIRLKGYTSWAIGMSVASLTKAILSNVGSVHAVSVLLQGFHDIEDEVFLSLPVSLGINGVNEIIIQQLSDTEKEALQKSAKLLNKMQQELKF